MKKDFNRFAKMMSCVDCVFSKPCFPKGVDMMREKAGIIPSQFGRQLRSKNSEINLLVHWWIQHCQVFDVMLTASKLITSKVAISSNMEFCLITFFFFQSFFAKKKRKKVAFLWNVIYYPGSNLSFWKTQILLTLILALIIWISCFLAVIKQKHPVTPLLA